MYSVISTWLEECQNHHTYLITKTKVRKYIDMKTLLRCMMILISRQTDLLTTCNNLHYVLCVLTCEISSFIQTDLLTTCNNLHYVLCVLTCEISSFIQTDLLTTSNTYIMYYVY